MAFRFPFVAAAEVDTCVGDVPAVVSERLRLLFWCCCRCERGEKGSKPEEAAGRSAECRRTVSKGGNEGDWGVVVVVEEGQGRGGYRQIDR